MPDRAAVAGLLCCVLLGASGCARRAARIPAPPALGPSVADLSGGPQTLPVAPDAGFIDLRPGWRLCVVTPLLKSGGYALRTSSAQASGNTVTITAGDELEGYETAFYSITSHPKGGVRISFASAEVTKEGKSAPQPRPVRPMFDLPSHARYVRLVFLTRISKTDHDMAVIAAADAAVLDSITAAIQTNPAACTASHARYCAWVPLGIAVRPEVPAPDPAGTWQPAR